MAALVIAAAGSAIGGVLFGAGIPALGLTGSGIGYIAGSLLASSFAPAQKTQGPRLSDLSVSTSSYGTPLPYVQGHPRVAGQIIWASAKREIATTTSQGKGGGGQENTTYTYEIDLLIELTDCEIVGIRRVWKNGELIITAASDGDSASWVASQNTPHWTRSTVYTGSASQLPDPTYEAAVGTANAPAYRGRGSVFIQGLQLGAGGQIPNLTFEVNAEGAPGSFSSSIFAAPLTANFADTVLPYASVSNVIIGTPTVSHSSAGALIRITAAPDDYTAEWSSSKIALALAPLLGQRVVLQAYYNAGNVQNISDTINFAFLGINGIGNDDVYFGISKAGGVVYLAAYTGASFVHIGPIGSYNNFRIAFLPDNTTTEWSASSDGTSWTVLYSATVSRPAAPSSIYLRAASPAYTPSGPGPFDYTVKDVLMYTGDAPITVTIFDNTNATISNVVSRLCLRAGLTAGQFDASALASITTPVRALAISQVSSARAILDTLASVYFFSATLSDKIYFKPLGGSAVATIPSVAMSWADAGGNPPEALVIDSASDLEIPAQNAITFWNVDGDYQTDTQYSDRLLTGQDSTNATQLPLGFTAAEGKAIANVITTMGAVRAKTTSLTLGLEYAHLECGDTVLAAGEDGSVYRLFLSGKKEADGVVSFTAALDDASAYTQSGTTTGGTSPQTTVSATAGTTLQLMDIPILRDTDNRVGHYYAIAPSGANWATGSVYQSYDNTAYNLQTTLVDSTVIGTCTTALTAYVNTGVGNIFDEAGTVTVNVGIGELSSATRDQILTTEDTNSALIGDEMVRFRTATLVSAGVYRLSGFLRGRRGTNTYTSSHIAGERFVLLGLSGLRFVVLNTAELGSLRYYKAASAGQRLSAVTEKTITPMGVGLKPFAVVDMRVDRTTADHVVSWKRRTRLSTRLVGPLAISAPLGEATEAYEVDIFANSTTAAAGTPVLRTLTSSTASVVYTAAQRATDGTGSTLVYARIYQLSATVGRGFTKWQSA